MLANMDEENVAASNDESSDKATDNTNTDTDNEQNKENNKVGTQGRIMVQFSLKKIADYFVSQKIIIPPSVLFV